MSIFFLQQLHKRHGIRFRRIPWRLLVFAMAAGAITNILTAWVHILIYPTTEIIRPAPGAIAYPDGTFSDAGVGHQVFKDPIDYPYADRAGSFIHIPGMYLRDFTPEGHAWWSDKYGWPVKNVMVVYGQQWQQWNAQTYIAIGIPLPWTRPGIYFKIPAALPFVPDIPSFFGTAAMYGVPWIGIALLFRAHLTRHRLRRHRCPRCTYDLSATLFNTTTSAHLKTPRCPECNWQPRRKSSKNKRTSHNEPATKNKTA